MRGQQRRVTLLVGLCFVAGAVARAREPSPDAIGAARIRGHMRFLADDLLEGREAGTRGFDVAAAYVAAQFEGMGLRPLDGGSYFQEVPLRRATAVDSRLEVRAGRDAVALAAGRDFVVLGHPTRETYEAEGEVVFAGHGVRAPEFRLDDYAGAVVRGRFVAFLEGAPEALPEPVRGFFQSWTGKWRTAADLGAVGTLSLATPSAKGVSWRDLASVARKGGLWPRDDPDRSPPWAPVVLSESGAERVLRASGARLRASLRVTTRHADVGSRNVVGILEGSGPARDQYVVYTAHLDHVGIGEPVDGDAIYNGAVDNASGVAALLCIAEAFTRLPSPPARSIAFLATTAEEPGLLGSEDFVRRGPIPSGQVVAALNIDGATLMVHPLVDVSAMGASNSTLGDAAVRAGKATGLEVRAEDLPLLGSDHFPFAAAGIPALWTIAGQETGRADLDGARLEREWMETRLHTPKDDMSQPLDFQAAADLAAFDFQVGLLVANGGEAPRWNEGTIVGGFLAGRRREAERRR
jgi:Peptidase family M28